MTSPSQTDPALDPERHFRELMDNAPDAILQVDANGNILIANRTVEQMFGYTQQELIGASVDMLVPGAARHKHAAHREG